MKTTVMAFGRANPVTSGHLKLFDKVKEVAKEHGADHKIILSHSQDQKKNPLSVEDKVKFARHYSPNTNIEGASKDAPTFLHHAKKLSDAGVEHLVMVAGSDRVDEFHKLLHKYNGQPGQHNFKKITVVSAGDRDPDAEGTEGMSASKLRAHAIAGDYEKFKSGLPAGDEAVHKEMYHKVRQGMKLECFIQYSKKLLSESFAYYKHAAAARQMDALVHSDASNKDHVIQAIKYHMRAATTAPTASVRKLHDMRIKQLLN